MFFIQVDVYYSPAFQIDSFLFQNLNFQNKLKVSSNHSFFIFN